MSSVKAALHEHDGGPEPDMTKEARKRKHLETKIRKSLQKFCQGKTSSKNINFVKDSGGKSRGTYRFLNQILMVVAASRMFHKDKGLPWNKTAVERTVVVFKRLLANQPPQYLDELTKFQTLYQALFHLISKTVKLEQPEAWYGLLLEMTPEPDKKGQQQITRFLARFEQYCKLAQLLGGPNNKVVKVCQKIPTMALVQPDNFNKKPSDKHGVEESIH